MPPESDSKTVDVQIRRRRMMLYVGALLALAVVGVVAVKSLASGDSNQQRMPVRMAPPLIVERIPLKPVRESASRGLAEVLRRGQADSLRVLATRLEPTTRLQVYQLVLAGGRAPEQLLGNEAVGDTGVFVGEARIEIPLLRTHRRVELRLVTNGAKPKQQTILRGAIPR